MEELEKYRAYLQGVLMAVAMQLRSLDAGGPGPDGQSWQTAASLITLWALFGFQQLVTDPMDERLGALNILITLIRLVRLQSPQTEAEAAELPAV